MKKNRKKYSLDELLERMPALPKNDQASSVGGYFCYTADGTFLGQTSGPNEIRIMNPGAEQNWSSSSEYTVMMNSQSLYGQSTQTIMSVMQNIANQAGVTTELRYGDFNDGSAYAAYNRDGRFIGINLYSDGIVVGNFYDLYYTLVHENVHATTNGYDPNMAEYMAYSAIYNSSDFNPCSMAFRMQVESQWKYYANQCGIPY